MGTNSYVFQVPPFMGNQETTIEELDAKKQHQRSHPMESALDHWTNPRLLPATAGSNRVIPPQKRGRSIAVFKKWISLEVVVPKNQWKSACRPIKLTMKPIFLSWRYDEWILFETTTSDRWFQNVQSRHQKKILLFLKNSILLEEIRRENRLLSTKPYQNVGIFEPYQRLWELAGFLVAINGHVSYWIKPPPRIW